MANVLSFGSTLNIQFDRGGMWFLSDNCSTLFSFVSSHSSMAYWERSIPKYSASRAAPWSLVDGEEGNPLNMHVSSRQPHRYEEVDNILGMIRSYIYAEYSKTTWPF